MKLHKDVLVTTSWDDGQKTDIVLANMLNKYGIKGTFYIAPYYNDPVPLDKNDVIEICKEHEIGAHTLHHIDLTAVSVTKAKVEIEESQGYIETTIGHKAKMFCYPLGRYNKNIIDIVKNCGFIGARTCNLNNPNSNPFELSISVIATNLSPFMALKTCWKFRLCKFVALLDWECRAKSLFDSILQNGGIYHIYGHSSEYESHGEWHALDSVLAYIAHREGVRYLTNGELIEAIL